VSKNGSEPGAVDVPRPAIERLGCFHSNLGAGGQQPRASAECALPPKPQRANVRHGIRFGPSPPRMISAWVKT
jgi:hypothetical protein